MDDPAILAPLITIAALLALYALRGINQINQWETALRFTVGKYAGKVEPGLTFVWPLFQRIIRIDNRIRNRELPRQMVITRDNVTAAIDAVVYYKVVEPEKAALNVENFELAVKDRAKVVLRDIVGEITLDELIGHRDEVAARIRTQVEQFVSQWGLHVELIALQDIQLPPTIQDALAKQATAERDKLAMIIKSSADVESAKNFAEAARMLYESPGAMELRRLEALQSMAGSGSRVIFDLARPDLQQPRQAAAAMAAAMATDSTGVRVDAGSQGTAGGQPQVVESQNVGASPVTQAGFRAGR
ncbi:MAG: SPFH domain-containing protein [Deltaproteobacteria bacterium]